MMDMMNAACKLICALTMATEYANKFNHTQFTDNPRDCSLCVSKLEMGTGKPQYECKADDIETCFKNRAEHFLYCVSWKQHTELGWVSDMECIQGSQYPGDVYALYQQISAHRSCLDDSQSMHSALKLPPLTCPCIECAPKKTIFTRNNEQKTNDTPAVEPSNKLDSQLETTNKLSEETPVLLPDQVQSEYKECCACGADRLQTLGITVFIVIMLAKLVT